MATNIPPHNLVEVTQACEALIEDRKLSVSDLLKNVKGPDFPTGGQILNSRAELRAI
jgi:DNA gyrase subunit A